MTFRGGKTSHWVVPGTWSPGYLRPETLCCLLFIVGSMLAPIGGVYAQDQGEAKLRAQQDSLARIRRERETLQQKMRGLQSRAHDISEEVDNLNRQHNATVRVVRSLDQQLTMLNGEVEHTTANLVR